jgi:hypothetical protein
MEKKFEVGQKVKLVNNQAGWFHFVIGDLATVVADTRGLSAAEVAEKGLVELSDVIEEAYDWEIVGEETKPFDLKTQPWYILVNNTRESEAAEDWLKSQGIDFQFPTQFFHDFRLFTNISEGSIVKPYMMADRDQEKPHPYLKRIQIEASEIKLQFETKTSITDVQWPVIPAEPVESEKDKAIRELQETIEKAKQQIDELMKH